MAPRSVKKHQYNPRWKQEVGIKPLEQHYWQPKGSKRDRQPRALYKPGETDGANPKAYSVIRPDTELMLDDCLLPSLVPSSYHTPFFVEAGARVPYCYAAKKVESDIFTYDQCMQSPEKEKWLQAMLVEIRSLEEHGTWVECSADEPNQLGLPIIPTMWTMRYKRSPSGEIVKHKGRLVMRGDLEKVDLPTTSPVVAWPTLRVVMTLSLFMSWPMYSADFSNAFVQSKMERPVYLHLPRGFKSKSPGRRCLKLLKSLYGSSTAPRDWFLHLTAKFKAVGLEQSKHDPCLWFKEGLVVAVFVDDCAIASKDVKIRDAFIDGLRKQGLVLTVESSFSEYLGIQIDIDDKKGTVKMTQPGLIKKTLAAANMSQCAPCKTLAKLEALGPDPNGEPFKESWGMASLNGLCLYLSSNTRPDITFAISQTCRYNHAPKQSHAQAMKHVLRYLKATEDIGLFVKKADKLTLEAYVDSDFAGLYKIEDNSNPVSAKSRMGYVVFLGNFPLIWKSKLIDSICLSTMESEYSSLSLMLRELIPVRRVVLELAPIMGYHHGIETTIWEDNESCRLLAVGRHLNSRNKYLHCKLHHWWDWMEANAKGKHPVAIKRVDTKNQRADYLTKSLPTEAHVNNRISVQGS